MNPLSPCFIIIVIITAVTLRCWLWCRQNMRYGWWPFGLGGRHAICTHYREREKEPQYTQYRLASSLGSWLIYNCCLISQKERAEPAASGQPSSYLHYCPLSLLLSLSVTLISPFSVSSLSLLPARSLFFSLPPALSVSLYLSLYLMF